MIYDEGEDTGHIYLANAPHFKCPVICALGVPKDLRESIGCHMQFLMEDHLKGHKKAKCGYETK